MSASGSFAKRHGAPLAGVALALAALPIGFVADDDVFVAVLGGKFPMHLRWYDLYAFSPGAPDGVRDAVAQGLLPWWSPLDLRIHLVRPLPSALFTLDHALFGEWAPGYHVTNILLWVLLLLAARALFARLFDARTANLATFIYAVSPGQSFPWAWICARHALIAAAGGAFGLYCAVRAHEDGWRPGRWLAPLSMVVGLSGGEAGLGGLAMWAAYALLGGGGRGRVARALAPIGMGLAYLVVYALVRGGCAHGGVYADPLHEPALFLTLALPRAGALLMSAFLLVPAELAALVTPWPFVPIGLSLSACVLLLYRAGARSEAATPFRWLVPGALLAMVGSLGGFPGSRENIVPDLAWSPLLATIITNGSPSLAGWRGALARGGVKAVFAVHVLLAPLVSLGTVANLDGLGRAIARVAHSDAVLGGAHPARVYTVAASDPMVAVYPHFEIAREGAPDVASWAVITAGRGTTRLTRTGDRTLAVEMATGALLRGMFELLYRSPREPVPVNVPVRIPGAEVRVTAEADGRPTRVEARFDSSLDDPSVRLLGWKDGAPVALHLAVGETVLVPWSPGPMGMM